jgi:hypothetical protein
MPFFFHQWQQVDILVCPTVAAGCYRMFLQWQQVDSFVCPPMKADRYLCPPIAEM